MTRFSAEQKQESYQSRYLEFGWYSQDTGMLGVAKGFLSQLLDFLKTTEPDLSNYDSDGASLCIWS